MSVQFALEFLQVDLMRRRDDRVTIITGKYAGRAGTVESNVFQRTVDFPDDFANGYHVVLDSKELVTVRVDQVVSCPH